MTTIYSFGAMTLERFGLDRAPIMRLRRKKHELQRVNEISRLARTIVERLNEPARNE